MTSYNIPSSASTLTARGVSAATPRTTIAPGTSQDSKTPRSTQKHTVRSLSDEFAQFCQRAGYDVDTPPPGAPIYRFPVAGDTHGQKTGWCVYNEAAGGKVAWGSVGDWRSRSWQSWRSWESGRGYAPTAEELEVIEQQRKQREHERKQEQDKLIAEAKARFEAAAVAEQHEYANTKAIKLNHEGTTIPVRISNGGLLIPMHNVKGEFCGMQRILATQNGFTKRFSLGTRKRGAWYCIGGSPIEMRKIIVCEGYATGATLHEATGLPVAVAFDAGNIQSVAESLRKFYCNLDIIICADDDYSAEKNTGKEAAEAAAAATSARVLLPIFPETYVRSKKDSDFNDLARIAGLDVVRQQLAIVTDEDTDAWPDDPEDFSSLPPVPELTVDVCPKNIYDIAIDINKNSGTPIDYIVSAFIVFFASLLSRFVMIRPKKHEDTSFFPNIFGLVVGSASKRKSGCIKEIEKRLRPLEAAEKARFDVSHDAWEKENIALKTVNEKIKKGIEDKFDKELKEAIKCGRKDEQMRIQKEMMAQITSSIHIPSPEPAQIHVAIGKSSPSAQISALKGNPGLLVFVDEMPDMLKSLMAPAYEEIKGFWLTGTDGGTLRDNTHSHGNRIVSRARPSLFGTTQIKRLGIFHEFDGGSGFLQRLQEFVWPDAQPPLEWTDVPVNSDAGALDELIKTLDKAAQISRAKEDEIVKLKHDLAKAQAEDDKEMVASVQSKLQDLTEENIYCIVRKSEESEIIFKEWHDQFLLDAYKEDGGEDSEIYKHKQKYPFFVLKLATIFQFLSTPDMFTKWINGDKTAIEIHADALRMAIARSNYLIAHAARLYNATPLAAKILSKIRAGSLFNHFTERDVFKLLNVQKLEPDARENKKRQIRKAIAELVKRRWIRVYQGANANVGRPTVKYEVHPDLIKEIDQNLSRVNHRKRTSV